MPAHMQVNRAQRVRAMAGGAFGILIAGLLTRYWLDSPHGVWLVAPMGASAVLVFAVPNSPLAQPWSVVGGNFFSALVGAMCAKFIPDPAWAGAAGVSLAIGLMFVLRCLHPPGGAAALLCALSGVPFSFAVFPVAINSVLLVVVAVIFNKLTGLRYPHRQGAPGPAQQPETSPTASHFTAADLDAALARFNQVLEVSRDDLEEVLHDAQAAAYQRTFGNLTCTDVMTRKPFTAAIDTPLDEAWHTMQQRQVKALPVVDAAQQVVGIVTVADFIRAAQMEGQSDIAGRLQSLVRRSGLAGRQKSKVVGQIMTTEISTAHQLQRLSELVPLYVKNGHHHLPIVDDDRQVVGIVTQSDMVRALYAASQVAVD